MNLDSSLAHNTSAPEVAPFERAHSPATTYATAQAFANHTPSASDATARELSSTEERDASVSDYHEAEEDANNSEGAVLNSSDLCPTMTRAPGNFMTRHNTGNGGENGMNCPIPCVHSLRLISDKMPIRTVNGIYIGVGFDKSLPALPDPFLTDAPGQTNGDSNNIASSGSSSDVGNTIDPFYASGPRVVLHSPYSMGNNHGDEEQSIFSKQALIDMDHHTHHVEIDLFSPVGIVAPFTVSDLKPLWRLRELRSLKIVGMQCSYQEFIWEVVWKNPHMERVTMEMAEAPALSERTKNLEWHLIQGSDWAPRKLCEVNAKYRGDSNNPGRLHDRNGWGEYLDVKAIIEAKQYVEHAVKRDLPTYDMPAKLQVKQLRLSGFVVDGKLPSELLLQCLTDLVVS